MPRYNVTIAMTLKITAQITVRAKDEDTATERVNEMTSDTRFGTLGWEVHGDKSRSDWTEEEIEVFMESIEEE
jgi:hypothetical protein